MTNAPEPEGYDGEPTLEESLHPDVRHWLCHNLLPSLRKHGCYPPPKQVEGKSAIVVPDGAAAALLELFGPEEGEAMRESFGF